MGEVGSTIEQDGIGVLTIDSPPVNALGIGVRHALIEGLELLIASETIKAIVLICGGRTFCAGADIREFGKPPVHPLLGDVLTALEGSRKPVVAAIHGNALGGGLELALACHYRIAVPSGRLGLPEVNLGLIPGAGGTQRLPRIVGVEVALDLITSGRSISASEALDMGVIDAIADETSLLDDAVAFARSIANAPLVRVRDDDTKIVQARGRPEIFAAFRKEKAAAFRGFRAPDNIIKAIEAAVELPFDEGLNRERELFLELRQSTQSMAQRYVFFAQRQTAKIPDVPSSTPILPIKSVGVIGAGTMGRGIAMNFLNIGIPVVLVEADQAVLDRGIGIIARNYKSSTKNARVTQAEVDAYMAVITPSLDMSALGDVDLVIETAEEAVDVKEGVFMQMDAIAKFGAILASNSSFLDLDQIAAATTRPEWVVGLHFFSPTNVTRLLEVVRGAKTSMEVLATAMAIAKKINKIPVLSGVCPGSIVDRIMAKCRRQAEAIILEGHSPAEIDKVLYDYGFALGPFQMIDLMGLDSLIRGQTGRSVYHDLVQVGLLGRKSGSGFYDYDQNHMATPSAKAAVIISDFAKYRGIVPRPAWSPEDILARLLYPVVNEGAKLLEEGIALRASDIDIAAILGHNWPIYTGGPMFWADTIGLPKIVAKLKEFEALHGNEFQPAALLDRLATEEKSFTQ